MPVSTKCAFSYDKIDHTKKNTGHLMVTLEVPERDFERTPLSTALVLDISGSMDGSMSDSSKSKIVGLKEVAKCLVQQLSSRDEVAIITYSTVSEVVLQRIAVKDKNKIYAAIDNLTTVATTNIGAGLIDGFKCLNRDFVGTKRVFLVSDGLNNTGMSSQQVRDLVRNRSSYGQDIILSTFGIGTDCDQELMADLAKLGAGNYYFVGNSSDMKQTFARELGGALSCEAQNIEIKIKPNNGNEVTKVLNDFTTEGQEDVAVIKAEDIYIGETKHVVVEVLIDAVSHPKPRKISVAHVEIDYHDVQTQKTQHEEHNVLVSFVSPDEANKEEKLEVCEQIALFKLAEASLKAVEQANLGDFVEAQAIYQEAVDSVDCAAAAGSILCSSVQNEVHERSSTWDPNNYNAEVGTQVFSDATGMLRNRATGGMSADLYSNVATKRMVKKFTDQEFKIDTPLEKIVGPPSVSKSDPETQKPEEPKKKGFGKKRSGNS